MSQVVFAAGSGTRLRPLTYETPKAMVPVLDVPLVEIALARGDAVEWADRFVNVSHASAPIRLHMERRPDVTVFDEGDQPLGTAATLRRLRSGLSETAVTYNCDLLSDISLQDLIGAHRRSSKACTLAVRPVTHGADITSDGRRLHLIDRRHNPAAGFLFLGAACFESDAFTRIGDAVPLGLVEGLLRPLMDDGEVSLFEHDGYARDTGTLARYLEGSIDALGVATGLVDPPGTRNAAPVRSYVGPHASVAEGSLGDGAIVLAGARVGSGARLANCIVWPGSVVPPRTELSGGIWFDGSLLPA